MKIDPKLILQAWQQILMVASLVFGSVVMLKLFGISAGFPGSILDLTAVTIATSFASKVSAA